MTETTTEKEVCELSNNEMIELGISEEHQTGSLLYFDKNGNELDRHARVMVPVPDPLPPYSRGRTRVPRADQPAQTGGEF